MTAEIDEAALIAALAGMSDEALCALWRARGVWERQQQRTVNAIDCLLYDELSKRPGRWLKWVDGRRFVGLADEAAAWAAHTQTSLAEEL